MKQPSQLKFSYLRIRLLTRTAAAALLGFLTFHSGLSRATTQSAGPESLHIAIAEGQGAINNVKQRTVREIIVQVQDENHKPVPSAVVTLVAPAQGPGGTFAGNQKSLSLLTDNGGRITTSAFHPNGVPGTFKLQVTASSQGRVATGAITQENTIASPPLGPTSHRSRLTRKKVILVAATLAAGIAISLSVGHHHAGYTPPGAY
jgi:hypothetical protein